MTTTKQDLLNAILEDPADDMRRLVYADYLAENGEEERAEFIRAQVGDRFGGQYTADVGMAKAYRPHAIPEWWPYNWGVQIKRGFVQWLRLPSADWFKHHEAITSQHPIEEVTLTTAVPLQIEKTHTGGTAVFNPERLDYIAVTNISQEDWTLYYLTHRWPRITFRLKTS